MTKVPNEITFRIQCILCGIVALPYAVQNVTADFNRKLFFGRNRHLLQPCTLFDLMTVPLYVLENPKPTSPASHVCRCALPNNTLRYLQYKSVKLATTNPCTIGIRARFWEYISLRDCQMFFMPLPYANTRNHQMT